MRRIPALMAAACTLVSVLGCGKAQQDPTYRQVPAGATAVAMKAADGAAVYGIRFLAAAQPGKAVILCFHQAGSNAWEYAEIAPRFCRLGYDALAIDQRSGGGMFGHENATAETYGKRASYMDAYQDLEAALGWAKENGYKTIVACGSSYSASLVLKLAADHPEVSAVMAFSPGEYFDEKGIVKGWALKARQPRFFASTLEEQTKEAKAIFAVGPAPGDRSFDVCVAFKDGVHGASALIASKNPKSADLYWKALEEWLQKLPKG